MLATNGRFAQRDALDVFFKRVAEDYIAQNARLQRAPAAFDDIAGCMQAELDAAISRMNPRLSHFHLRLTPTQPHERWHYPNRDRVCDGLAKSFMVSLWRGGEGVVVSSVLFAVLPPEVLRSERGATILASGFHELDRSPRHYVDLHDVKSVRLVVENELVRCVEPELRAMMPHIATPDE